MTEEKQGAAEWLREKAQSVRRSKGFGCKELMASEFGESCDGRRCADCYADLFGRIADRIDAERALPEGMEWPRFEDGELVEAGDEVEFEGEAMRVRHVRFFACNWALHCEREGVDGILHGSYGERVKRPAPKVLDAEGVPIEVGDTVWATYGEHRKHVVRTVCSDGRLHPNLLTVDGCMVDYEDGGWDFAKRVTHKPPDSWEKLEEDVMRGTSCRYFGFVESAVTCFDCPHGIEQTGTPCWKNERIDILKRAKKLAGIEEEEQR